MAWDDLPPPERIERRKEEPPLVKHWYDEPPPERIKRRQIKKQPTPVKHWYDEPPPERDYWRETLENVVKFPRRILESAPSAAQTSKEVTSGLIGNLPTPEKTLEGVKSQFKELDTLRPKSLSDLPRSASAIATRGKEALLNPKLPLGAEKMIPLIGAPIVQPAITAGKIPYSIAQAVRGTPLKETAMGKAIHDEPVETTMDLAAVSLPFLGQAVLRSNFLKARDALSKIADIAPEAVSKYVRNPEIINSKLGWDEVRSELARKSVFLEHKIKSLTQAAEKAKKAGKFDQAFSFHRQAEELSGAKQVLGQYPGKISPEEMFKRRSGGEFNVEGVRKIGARTPSEEKALEVLERTDPLSKDLSARTISDYVNEMLVKEQMGGKGGPNPFRSPKAKPTKGAGKLWNDLKSAVSPTALSAIGGTMAGTSVGGVLGGAGVGAMSGVIGGLLGGVAKSLVSFVGKPFAREILLGLTNPVYSKALLAGTSVLQGGRMLTDKDVETVLINHKMLKDNFKDYKQTPPTKEQEEAVYSALAKAYPRFD